MTATTSSAVSTAREAADTVLEVTDLKKHFRASQGIGGGGGLVYAVDGVSLNIGRGEVLGLVGESGSGKSTVGRCIMRLLEPTSGTVRLNGVDVTGLSRRRMRPLRREMHMVFQDPYSSLNPRMTAGQIVEEPLRLHGVARGSEAEDRVGDLFEKVGLGAQMRFRYPHELSGGQRQRVVIAAALALEPALLIADEPVSMLDVSIRAEILNLLDALARDRGIAVVMITHDLSTVAAYADRIAVMYLGRIVEHGPTREVLTNPQHPYAQALLSVVPIPDPAARRRPVILGGETPDPSRMPSGCRFHPRCPLAFDRCPTVDPPLYPAGPAHAAACLLLESGPRRVERPNGT
jgi:oligopeptide transport system ATP-binding protein